MLPSFPIIVPSTESNAPTTNQLLFVGLKAKPPLFPDTAVTEETVADIDPVPVAPPPLLVAVLVPKPTPYSLETEVALW